MKISAETAQILNSGQAFEVLERRPAPGGRTLVCLGGPFEADCTWVYEEFVEYV